MRHQAVIAASVCLALVGACSKPVPRADSGSAAHPTSDTIAGAVVGTVTDPSPPVLSPTPPATDDSSSADRSQVLSPNGFGVVRIGASISQLAAAVGTRIPPAHSADERACRYVMLAMLPSGVRVMLVNDSVARIDVSKPGPHTAAEIGIGDTESQVTSAYGDRASVRPNKYTGPAGHDIVVSTPGDATRRLIFETDGKKVLRLRAGRQPAVDLVEGCA